MLRRSVMGHERTRAPQQSTNRLLDHLVSAGEHGCLNWLTPLNQLQYIGEINYALVRRARHKFAQCARKGFERNDVSRLPVFAQTKIASLAGIGWKSHAKFSGNVDHYSPLPIRGGPNEGETSRWHNENRLL